MGSKKPLQAQQQADIVAGAALHSMQRITERAFERPDLKICTPSTSAPMSVMCEVSASGYFNWKRTQDEPGSGPSRFQSDESLLAHMRAPHAQIKRE